MYVILKKCHYHAGLLFTVTEYYIIKWGRTRQSEHLTMWAENGSTNLADTFWRDFALLL